MGKGYIQPEWYVLDATDKILGRLAVEVAQVILGKRDVRFAQGVDLQKYVIVTNAAKVAVTGKKMEQKTYFRHSGYVGNMKIETLAEKMASAPEKVIELAVKGMLPSNTHGRHLLSHLKVYAGAKHDQQAQKPELLVF
jgi:large subunit ribosomal protein L13